MMMSKREDVFKTFERTGWDRCVDAYDSAFTPLTSQAGSEMLRQLAIKPSEEVLDIACGPGHFTSLIAQTDARVTGADFSPPMIARAQERYPGISFQVQDAEALGYDDGSYDVVTMNFGMLHLGSPERATAEVARVLRPGGRFGFTVWAQPEQAMGFSVILKAVEQHGASHVALPAGPPFFKYSDPDAARVLLTAAGFNSIRAEQVNLIWRLSSPEEFFGAFHMGTARTGGLLRAQPEDHLSLIKEAVESSIRELCSSGEGIGLAIPMGVMVYTGRK